MRVLVVSLGVGLFAIGAPAFAADQIIKLSECGLSNEAFREAAEYSFTKRRYNIEENTPTLVVGEQDDKRVEIVIEPDQVVIRWKEGFGSKNDQWLRNLKTDVLWRLAE
ncbi:MAG TPA: hypothetical protein VIQ99_09655 [Gammaproteobacteria bacterium]